ncbi:MAG: ABC transporter permease [Ruminococcus sp.]|nr:ABC transporter permease [Ruminococcus sp.]
MFTFSQNVKAKWYKIVTLGIPVILCLLFIIISCVIGVSEKSNNKVCYDWKIYLNTENNAVSVPYDAFGKTFDEFYPGIEFTEKKYDKSDKNTENSLIVEMTSDGVVQKIKTAIPAESNITEKEAKAFTDRFKVIAENARLMDSGISADDLRILFSGTEISYKIAGENRDDSTARLAKLFIPMLLTMMLYIMVIINSQSVISIVSIEKTSKLMESILTFVDPFSLITGKILSAVVNSLIQSLLWIAGIIVGCVAGHYIVVSFIYSDYYDYFYKAAEMISGSIENFGVVILIAAALCVSFVFFCSVAGLCASFISKTDNISQANMGVLLVSAMGFLLAYSVPLKNDEALNNILRMIPFSASYMIPGDLIIRNISMIQGILYLLLLALFSAGIALSAAIVYKKRVMYVGK